MSPSLIKYVLIAALRDRLVLALFLVLVVGTSLSVFLGSSAIIEQDIFAVVFIAGSLRIAAVLGLCLFVIFFVRKSYDSKDVEFLLSRPIGRISFVLSYSMAFNIIAIMLSLAVLALVCGMNYLRQDFGGAWVWGLSLTVESIIMVNTAFFFALYMSSASNAAMALSAFYILARMMGQILGIIESKLVESHVALDMMMNLVSILIPRLDLMAQNNWLIYGYSSDLFAIYFIIGQCLVFYFLIINAVLLDFIRRQF
tara:strand:+ start:201 stop:965 length:765 start_codon:yes stop_codon:yes gene_type:complete